MVKRKKRLEKGIQSLKKQEDLHMIKRKQAEEDGNFELVGYYDKELIKIKREREKKKDRLEKE